MTFGSSLASLLRSSLPWQQLGVWKLHHRVARRFARRLPSPAQKSHLLCLMYAHLSGVSISRLRE